MTSKFKMLTKKSINQFRLFHSTIVFAKSFLQSTTSLFNILHVTMFGISSWNINQIIDFQSKSELLTTDNFLPFTDEVRVELVHKCLQQLHLLALRFEILGYIPGLLNGLEYLRRTGDFSGDNLTRRLLWNILVLAKPLRLTEDADKRFSGLNLTAGIKVRKL